MILGGEMRGIEQEVLLERIYLEWITEGKLGNQNCDQAAANGQG